MTINSIYYSPYSPYGSSPPSIPTKQIHKNNFTNCVGGMPLKTGFADNSNTFSKGRQVYLKTNLCSYFVHNGSIQYKTGVIRVEGDRSSNCNKLINGTNTWSSSNHSIRNRRSNTLGCANIGSRCLINGKQNTIVTSQELIEYKKNKAIGRGSTILPGQDPKLSFNSNNLNNSNTNTLSVKNARQRTRNRGYIVPPKCRVVKCL